MGETDLRDFSIENTCFTLVLVVLLLKKYLLLNVPGYSAQEWYILSGLEEGLNLAVIVAVIHFFAGVYGLRHRKTITIAFIVMAMACMLLIPSPTGAVLDAGTRTIRFGVGFRIAILWYFLSFTVAILLGYGAVHHAWHTERRNFLLGLLIFAAIGYLETLTSLVPSLRRTAVTLSTENDFLFSGIPYALYGIFLIVYFMRHPATPAPVLDTLPQTFLTKYGITDRESEIILKVVQGKSNADIAGELFISLATVKTHLHNIYRKIDVDSRYDLLARVRSGQ
jgi:DNA-binding CsgD family transcriptional regulator